MLMEMPLATTKFQGGFKQQDQASGASGTGLVTTPDIFISSYRSVVIPTMDHKLNNILTMNATVLVVEIVEARLVGRTIEREAALRKHPNRKAHHCKTALLQRVQVQPRAGN